MRTLDEIVAAVRSNETYTEDELVYAVVAFDVLLHQLDLPNDTTRLQKYFIAAESSPREFIGEANDPANQEAVAWYKAMHTLPTGCNCNQVEHNIECDLHPEHGVGCFCIQCLGGDDDGREA